MRERSSSVYKDEVGLYKDKQMEMVGGGEVYIRAGLQAVPLTSSKFLDWDVRSD